MVCFFICRIKGRYGPHIHEGSTPLILAVLKCNMHIVQYLLQQTGLCLEEEDNHGFTALTASLFYKVWEMAPVLLDAGSDINHR